MHGFSCGKRENMKFKDFVKRVIEVLKSSDIDYVIVGGLAVIYYGEPRVTQGINVIIDNRRSDKEEILYLCRLFLENKFIVIGECDFMLKALKEKTHITVLDEDYTFRVDLQGIYHKLNVLAFEGRRRVKIFDVETWLHGPEDLIIAKLTYYIGNRDLRDVISMIKNSWDLVNEDRLWRLEKNSMLKIG